MAGNEGQIAFKDIKIDDHDVEVEIAEQCALIEKNRAAASASAFAKATAKRKALLPVASLEEPSTVLIDGGKHGNWIIALTPKPTNGYTVADGRAVGIKAAKQD